MRPAIAAAVFSDVMSKYVKNGIDMLQPFIDRAKTAQSYHDEMFVKAEDPLEEERNECLQDICDIQHTILLEVDNPAFFKKMLPLTIEQIGNTYEAKSSKDLKIISMGLHRIKNALDSYENEKKDRKKTKLVAVIVSLLSLTAIGIFIALTRFSEKDHIPILMLPLPVLLWSIIGSFAAILYRFTNAGDNDLEDPYRWLFTRPLTGIIMGCIAYLVLRVGLITVQPDKVAAEGLGTSEMMWLIAFLAGFSDRFSDALLKTTIGRFGGEADGELLTIQMNTQTTKTGSATLPVMEEVHNLAPSSNAPVSLHQKGPQKVKLSKKQVKHSGDENVIPAIETETKSVENKQIIVNSHLSKEARN